VLKRLNAHPDFQARDRSHAESNAKGCKQRLWGKGPKFVICSTLSLGCGAGNHRQAAQKILGKGDEVQKLGHRRGGKGK